MPSQTYKAYYFGNYADIDPNESNSTYENTGALNGQTSSRGGDLGMLDITMHDGDATHGDDNAISENDTAGGGTKGDSISYSYGGVNYSNVDIDAAKYLNITVTETNGTVSSLPVYMIQMTNGDVFIVDSSNNYLDGKEIQSFTFGTISTTTAHNHSVGNFSGVEGVSNLSNQIVDGEETGEVMGIGYNDAGQATDGGGDIIDGADGDNDSIRGNGGDDNIYAGAGNDTVDGGADNDTVDGGSGSDTLYGGEGDDYLRNIGPTGQADNQADEIYGGAGDDTIIASFGNDTIDGGDDIDLYDTSALSNQPIVADLGAGTASIGLSGSQNQVITNVENLTTGTNDDDLTGSDVANVITSNAGDDTIDGGAGNDTLDGGADDDVIDGGTGDDITTGGTGNDTFVGLSGNDTITDFNTGNTGSITDGDQTNNDFVDLSGYYNDTTLAAWNAANPTNQFADPLSWMRADQADDGILNATEAGWDAANTLTIQSGGAAVAGADLTFDNTNVVCFAAGTMIQTQMGEVAVEDLRQGDMVLTRDRGFQPLRWVGGNKVSIEVLSENANLRPIRIKAGAFGSNLPQQDLLVSPQHRVLVSSKIVEKMFDGEAEVLIAAKQLVMIDGIDVADDVDSVEYFHFLFDQHEIVFSNGAETESLFTGPEALKAVSPEAQTEILTLFPELSSIDYPATACRTIVKGRKGRQLAVRHKNNNKPLLELH